MARILGVGRRIPSIRTPRFNSSESAKFVEEAGVLGCTGIEFPAVLHLVALRPRACGDRSSVGAPMSAGRNELMPTFLPFSKLEFVELTVGLLHGPLRFASSGRPAAPSDKPAMLPS